MLSSLSSRYCYLVRRCVEWKLITTTIITVSFILCRIHTIVLMEGRRTKSGCHQRFIAMGSAVSPCLQDAEGDPVSGIGEKETKADTQNSQVFGGVFPAAERDVDTGVDVLILFLANGANIFAFIRRSL